MTESNDGNGREVSEEVTEIKQLDYQLHTLVYQELPRLQI